MYRKRILLVSDTHNCHIDWYGVPNAERQERLIRDLNAEYDKDPYEFILFLGDYALDHWLFWKDQEVDNSYIKTGKCNAGAFFANYASRLKAPYYAICGNHEQYGNAKWKALTGFERQFTVTLDDIVFLMLDQFSSNLDPVEHSDGIDTPIDTAYVRNVMAENPDKQFILCAHHFNMNSEPEESRALLRDKRVLCLFSGHVHLSDAVKLPDACGGKMQLLTGNYSYSINPEPESSLWGFRDLIITKDKLISRYIVPDNTLVLDGKTITKQYGYQDEAEIAR